MTIAQHCMEIGTPISIKIPTVIYRIPSSKKNFQQKIDF